MEHSARRWAVYTCHRRLRPASTTMTFRIGIGLLALLVLSACATHGSREHRAGSVKQCPPTQTLTCDRFAGENYNCSCQRGDNLRDMLDPNGTG